MDLSVYLSSGFTGRSLETEQVSWEAVREALELTKRHANLVGLHVPGVDLYVGGGPEWFLVTVFFGVRERSFVLVEDHGRVGEVELVIGGQETEMDRRELVGYPTAFRAAQHFFERSEMTPDDVWVEA